MKYNRKILLPYLRCVMEMEMICDLLENKKACIYSELNNCQAYIVDYQSTQKPEKRTSIVFGCLFKCLLTILIGGGIYAFLISISPEKSKNLHMMILIISLGIILLLCYLSYCTFKRKNKFISMELNIYKTKKQNADMANKSIEMCRQKLSELEDTMQEALNIKQYIYSANVIPMQCRDLYSATYMYRYLITSREDDMNKIVETFMMPTIQQTMNNIKTELEMVKFNPEKYDKYINALSKEIDEINQLSFEEQRAILSEEINKELNEDYTKMIKCSEKAVNYFVSAKYAEVLKF